MTETTPTLIMPDELPSWMRPHRRRFDWGIVFAVAFTCLAIWPLFTRIGFPMRSPALMTLYRSLDMAQLIRVGELYSRWSPSTAYGYGSPIYNFVEPLPHHLAAWYQVLMDGYPVVSVKMLFALFTLIGSLAIYALIMRRSGSLAGILAVIIYLFNPLFQHLILNRCDLGSVMILGLLSLVLWSVSALHYGGASHWFWLTVLGIMGLWLTDASAALVCIPLIVVFDWIMYRLVSGRLYSLLPLVLGLLLSLFFLWPAIQAWPQYIWQPTAIDTYFAAIPLTEWLTGLGEGRSLGLWVVLTLALGIIACFRIRRRTLLALLVPIGLGLLFSSPLWGKFFAPASTFWAVRPYHWLLPALVGSSYIGAQALHMFKLRPHREYLVGMSSLILVLLIGNVPSYFFHPKTADVEPLTLMSMTDSEQAGEHWATRYDGRLTLRGVPMATTIAPLNILEDVPIDRLIVQDSAATVEPLEIHWLSASYKTNTMAEHSATFNAWWLPEWKATWNGFPLLPQPNKQGLININIPGGGGQLNIYYENQSLYALENVFNIFLIALTLIAGLRIHADPIDYLSNHLNIAEMASLGFVLIIYVLVQIVLHAG